MKPFTRVLSAFAVGILLQGGIYLYLDQYMFAPTTEFNVAGASKDDTKNFPDVKEGTKLCILRPSIYGGCYRKLFENLQG